MLYSSSIDTPLGEMFCVSHKDGICLLEFTAQRNIPTQIAEIEKALEDQVSSRSDKHITSLRLQLREYFRGKPTHFNVPLLFIGTNFQIKVWEKLRDIPYGETRTYLQLARSIANPKGVRAVAGANGRNKIAIVVPCHRVIGSDGSMTGYAGGIDKKRFLLELERSTAGPGDLFTGINRKR